MFVLAVLVSFNFYYQDKKKLLKARSGIVSYSIVYFCPSMDVVVLFYTLYMLLHINLCFVFCKIIGMPVKVGYKLL